MESDDDYQLFLYPMEESSSPIHRRKLKRLKKTVSVSDKPIDLPKNSIPSTVVFDSLKEADIESSKTLDLRNLVDPMRSESVTEALDGEADSNSSSDDLFDYGDRSEPRRRALDFEEDAQLGASDVATDELGGNDGRRTEIRVEIGDSKMEKSANKRQSLEGVEEKKTKKMRVKNVGHDGKSESKDHTKRKIEKERKTHLETLHAESQRLLRETKDAAFKPVPLVQKPLSSVLEKIHRRKLEVSKKASILKSYNDFYVETTDYPREIFPEHVKSVERGDDEHKKSDTAGHPVNAECNIDDTYVDGSTDFATPSGQHENTPPNTKHENIPSSVDLFCDSQPSDSEDAQTNCHSGNPLEEVFTPSLLTMNLKFDSALPDDVSSDEEDDDKENIDPHPHAQKLVNVELFPKGDPVKAFLDDEAEEEDDSDNDLRFQENEEDEENEETDELDDLIVTGYEEKAIDSERRDELHQKWLEQQDAAATDNVLQNLKCGFKQIDPTMLDIEGEVDEIGEDSMDEDADDLLPTNAARINSRKVKQMIPQMFTDKDDIFLSSDDEETEQRMVRQRLIEKTEQQAPFLSPAENENSREVFGLIKKLNIAPETKKKAKISSVFDMLITGGNSNSSSRSSFLGRATSNSLPSSHKHGSSTVRSFIFGRDDSNGRSGPSTSEVSSDKDQNENRPMRSASAKFSSSRTKFSSQNTKIATETISGSLFEILRSSSMQSNHHTPDNIVGHTETVFAAFKSGKKAIKIEGRT